jgi:hypothetical protein
MERLTEPGGRWVFGMTIASLVLNNDDEFLGLSISLGKILKISTVTRIYADTDFIYPAEVELQATVSLG